MVERLRIAQVAPIAGPVTRHSGGSIEQLVWLLTEEFIRRGHDVTLFATGDSQTSAKLHAVYPYDYENDINLCDWQFREMMHMASVFEHAHEFDVIHSHVYHYALPFIRLVSTPVIHTYHVLPDDDVIDGYIRYPEAHIAAISHYQRQVLTRIPDVAVIHHGIDTAAFPFNPERGDYILFLGRIVPSKGPIDAIHLAREVGIRLILVGPTDDSDYFQSEVAPLIDGHHVEYLGPVYGSDRNALLAGAALLLYPVAWPEPFGLVMVEAMACGTPVAALGWGAVPEIVDNGRSGYYTHDVESLVAAIPRVLDLDRAIVRQTAVARFDYRRMADDYLAFYTRVVADQRSHKSCR